MSITNSTVPVLVFNSYVVHQERAVTVRVYQNRIEWEAVSPLRKLLGIGTKNTDTLYLRTVTGIGTEKARIGFTHVTVTSAANIIRFRVTKSHAEQIISVLNKLITDQ